MSYRGWAIAVGIETAIIATLRLIEVFTGRDLNVGGITLVLPLMALTKLLWDHRHEKESK